MDAWPETQRLWQVQLTHDAAPSYLIHIVDAFNRHLSSLREADPESPKDLVALKRDCNVVWQITHVETNTQNAPLANWRVVFYAVGNREALHEFVTLLHGYMKFRALTHWPTTGALLLIRPSRRSLCIWYSGNDPSGCSSSGHGGLPVAHSPGGCLLGIW